MELSPFNVAVVATVLFIVKMALMAFFGVDDESAETEGVFAVVSINKILAYFMGFGFSYDIVHRAYNTELISFCVGMLVGVLYVILYSKVMKNIKGLSEPVQFERTWPPVGSEAVVYLTVSKTIGSIMWKGREYPARTNANQTIPAHNYVTVKEIKTNYVIVG